MDSERLREQGLRSLLRLQEQGLATAATLRPERNPVDDAFKPPDEMAHSYMVASSKPSRVIQAKAVLHVPPSLARELRHTSSAIRPSSASRLEGSSASQPVQHHGSAMRSVRRWDMLPKHAWLMASESGQAPGPGFREVSPTRPIRPFGPNALSGTVTTAAEAAAPRHDGRDAASHATLDASSYMSASVGAKRPPVSMMERKAALKPPSPSGNIAAFYTPTAAGLVPATLDSEKAKAELHEMQETRDSPEPATAAAALGGADGAGSEGAGGVAVRSISLELPPPSPCLDAPWPFHAPSSGGTGLAGGGLHAARALRRCRPRAARHGSVARPRRTRCGGRAAPSGALALPRHAGATLVAAVRGAPV